MFGTDLKNERTVSIKAVMECETGEFCAPLFLNPLALVVGRREL
jgi:hypothetical protein